MQAAYTRKQGLKSILEVGECPKPRLKNDEILIEVHSASINPLDWKVFNGIQYLPMSKFIFGHDVAGVVKEVGKHVKRFAVGDEVYACINSLIGGGFAEFVACNEMEAAKKPNNLSFTQAAALPMAALTAWQGLHLGNIYPGSRVVINGASGGVGTCAVQLAKALGAYVIGVCSEKNMALVKSLGADETIDYTKEKFYDVVNDCDLVLDTVGNVSLKECDKTLKKEGSFVTTIPNVHAIMDITRTNLPGPQSHTPKAKMVFIRASANDLELITPFIERGELKPVVDKHFSLDQIGDAWALSQSHHAQGKLVVDVRQ